MDTPPVVQTSSTTATAGGAVYEPTVIEWWQDSSTPTIMETQQLQHQQQPPQQQQAFGTADAEADTAAHQQTGTHQMERAPSLELKMETVIPNREEITRAKEQSREDAQLRTYTRWINSQLKDGSPPIQINDPIQDLRNGVVLINLLHRLYGIQLPHYHMQPSSKIHALDNVVMAFNMLEQVTSTSYPFLKPANVIDGDVKMMMGMIWTLVLDSGVRKPLAVGGAAASGANTGEQSPRPLNMQSFEQTANAALLNWCQERTKGYEGVNIQNFTESFADGLAFNALLHSYDPSLVEYQMLNPAARDENLRIAFTTAEHRLGIPQLLDVSDLDGQHPIDAHSVITYVSEYVKRFEAPRSEQHRPPSPVPVPAYVAPVEVEPLSFPQPVAPPLPPRQQTQQATMGYDPYAGYQQQTPPPYGYGLTPPVGYYAPPAYHPQPPVHQQAPQGQGVNLYDHRKPKGGIGRRLVEKTYLWGKN